MEKMNKIRSAKPALLGASLLVSALVGFSAPARADSPAMPASIVASKTLAICSAMTQPPFEFFDAQQQPEGTDIEMGTLLAKTLGLKVQWINVPFSGVIPALLAGHCDAVLSGLNITPSRLATVDMLPYRYAGTTILLKAGAPPLSSVDALSGKKVVTVIGTAAIRILETASDKLVKAGKKPIILVKLQDNASALQSLQFGQVDAFGVAYETASYYMQIEPGVFEFGTSPLNKVQDGIAVPKDEPGLEAGLNTALATMRANGSYAALYNKWHIGLDILE
jgi:polar amino acid transport system substrate-binding protein